MLLGIGLHRVEVLRGIESVKVCTELGIKKDIKDEKYSPGNCSTHFRNPIILRSRVVRLGSEMASEKKQG